METRWLRSIDLMYSAISAIQAATVDASIEIPVQINGKVKAKISVPNGIDKGELESAAKSDGKVVELLDGKQVVKTVVVPGRLVNFVVK